MWFSLLLWLLFASPTWTTESSSRGSTIFHKTYIDEERRTSCAECHNISEQKYHNLKTIPSEAERRLFLSQFHNEGVRSPQESCLNCHQPKKSRYHSFLSIGPKSSLQKSRFDNSDAACLKCHNIQEKHYFSVKKSGPPLRNSFFRKHFNRSKFDNLKDAVADCMTSYQLRNNDEDLRDIVAYLKTISHPQNHEAHQYGVLSDYLPLRLDGNKFLGKSAYEHSCLPCHSRFKITLLENPLSREGIYRKVRGMSRPRLVAQQNMNLVQLEAVPQQNITKGFELKRFPKMPVFSQDRLSDFELLNIANYLV